MTKKFERVLSDDWLPLEFQSGNSVPVTSVMVNLRTLKSIVEQTEQAVLQSPEIQALQKDVERYRWLRLQRTIADYACVTWNIGHDWVQMDGAELDAAIDHARRAEGGGE